MAIFVPVTHEKVFSVAVEDVISSGDDTPVAGNDNLVDSELEGKEVIWSIEGPA